jgi:ABC-type lipoprotein export system ATPase subunit
MSAAPLIIADGVTKSLRSGDVDTPVLRGVTLSIARGTFAAIVGPSGCGKTTFLSLLGALDHADGGRLIVDGVDLRALEGGALDAYRREKVGIVLQFYSLLPSLNALENVETSREFVPLSDAQRRKRAQEYLAHVGLARWRQLAQRVDDRLVENDWLCHQPRRWPLCSALWSSSASSSGRTKRS